MKLFKYMGRGCRGNFERKIVWAREYSVWIDHVGEVVEERVANRKLNLEAPVERLNPGHSDLKKIAGLDRGYSFSCKS